MMAYFTRRRMLARRRRWLWWALRDYRAMWLLALLVVLPACQLPPDRGRVGAILTVAEACKAYTSALRVLTPYRHTDILTAEQVLAVDQANMVTDPICLGAPPADAVDAATRVTSEVAAVMLIVSQAQER